eukprot:scaffold261_cov336-Pavlova_lutheri.AAC.16
MRRGDGDKGVGNQARHPTYPLATTSACSVLPCTLALLEEHSTCIPAVQSSQGVSHEADAFQWYFVWVLFQHVSYLGCDPFPPLDHTVLGLSFVAGHAVHDSHVFRPSLQLLGQNASIPSPTSVDRPWSTCRWMGVLPPPELTKRNGVNSGRGRWIWITHPLVLGGKRQSGAVRTSTYEPGSLIETLPLGWEGWFGVQKGKDPGLKGQGFRDSA